MTSCGLDCVDKKTGIHKSSQTLKEAKQNDVFRFEVAVDKSAWLQKFIYFSNRE
jgi:hypothetical protein